MNFALVEVAKNINNVMAGKHNASLLQKKIIGTNIFVIICFILFFVIGLSIYKDFGISWDEYRNRETGLISLNYIQNVTGINLFEINENIPELDNFIDKDYGVFFELFLVFIEKILSLNDFKDIFYLRHLITFIFFWISCIAFYKLAEKITHSQLYALIATLMLIISPRIFADSFYNSKDIALLSGFIITIYTLLKFLETTSWKNLIILSLCSAILINIRLSGIIIPIITCFYLLLPYKLSHIEIFAGKKIIKTLTFIFLTGFLTIMLWPYLWTSPIQHFIEAFSNMSSFNRWDNLTLYRGKFIKPSPPPWHYIPTWIGITTPLIYLICFIVGFCLLIIQYYKKIYDVFNIKKYGFLTIIFIWLFVPYITTLILHSTLYDGWRHLYFIYPPIILIGIYGITVISGYLKNKYTIKKYYTANIIVLLPVLINMIIVSIGMIKNHPQNQVYFNCLAGKNSGTRYELDYWGLSYRQAIETILKNDTSSQVKIMVHDSPAFYNSLILDKSQKNRLIYCSDSTAKYFISNFRFKANYEKYRNNEYPYVNEIFAVKAWKNKIAGVYLLK